MRILLDECAPRPLKRELADYEIRTVVEMGWSGKKNGELLRLMSQEGFTILLTTDQNLRYQQNLQQAGVAVIVLVASSNRLPDLANSAIHPTLNQRLERGMNCQYWKFISI